MMFPSAAQTFQAMTSPGSAEFLKQIRDKTATLVEKGIEAEMLDVDNFQKALIDAFGREAEGIKKADGGIDYVKLDDLMGGAIARKRQEFEGIFSAMNAKRKNDFGLFGGQNALFNLVA